MSPPQAAGNHQVEEIQPNGFKVESAYDALNRLVRKEIRRTPSPSSPLPLDGGGLGGGGVAVETFAYDGLSRMTRAQNFDPFDNPIGNVEYEYDSLSRVVAEIQNGRRLAKIYDGVGNVTIHSDISSRPLKSL